MPARADWRFTAEGRLDRLIEQGGAIGGFVLEHADRAGLLLEQRRDEVVERVLGDEVGDEGRLELADAVDPVLGLPVVAGHPVQVVEDDVRAGGEVDADAGGVQVAEEDADALVVLEGGLRCGALLLSRRARDDDRRVAELGLQLLDRLGERREDDDLLAGSSRSRTASSVWPTFATASPWRAWVSRPRKRAQSGPLRSGCAS